VSERKYILVAEDERDLAELLRYNLNIGGYDAEVARDGKQALEMVAARRPDLIVLDIMMPVHDGIAVARQLRSDDSTKSIPIVMLTAKASDADQVSGLRAGADDYVTKPFSIPVLLARIEAVLRRTTEREGSSSILTLGGVDVDTERHEVRMGDETIRLTLTEFRLLATLMAAPGRVLTRQSLISRAIGPGITVTERTIDVHVAAIRKKLGDAGTMIKTVRGVGYRMTETGTDED
jgi:two-component system phosphate regulon response regulator PhoB